MGEKFNIFIPKTVKFPWGICMKCYCGTLNGTELYANVKALANGLNKSQHCCVLLGVFGQQCCVRLHGPKSLTGFKLYTTSANKCQHCCGSMQTDAKCWAQQCYLLLAKNVASVCMGVKYFALNTLKAYANWRNILGQQLTTLLGLTCYVRLHGTTTMLALVGTCFV